MHGNDERTLPALARPLHQNDLFLLLLRLLNGAESLESDEVVLEDGVEAFDPAVDVDLRRKVSEALDREEVAFPVLTQLLNKWAVDV